MSKIQHPAITKAYNGKVIGAVIGLVLTALAVIMFLAGGAIDAQYKDEAIPFGQAYNEDRLDEDIFVYVDVTVEPFEFAYYDNGEHYYFITDSSETYIMKGYESDCKDIREGIARDGYYTLVGVIDELTDDEIIDFAIEAYNEGETDPDKIINRDDFDYYFADVAINPNSGSDGKIGLVAIGILVLTFGLIILIAAGLEAYHYSRFMKNLNDYQAQYIANELYNPQTYYIKKCRVYLTPTCIVSLGNKMEVVPYNNILWAYRFNQSMNFIPTLTNITVMKKDFTTCSIADMTSWTIGKQEIINQIFSYIQAYNPEVLIGYTTQNQTYVNQLRTQQTMQNRMM